MKKENLYLIIMAGGIGSRFWPMSTSVKPKQFQDFLGAGESLIQMTYKRYRDICPAENILVVTNQAYKAITQEQLPELPEANIIAEPFRRNTAPCIALASIRIQHLNKDATVIVSPADHLILDQKNFDHAINEAINTANEASSLVTIGIKPSRPDTGYGYIHFADGQNSTREVISFTEKPVKEKAEAFLKSGDYYWNSGMFIWKNTSIMKAFELFLPNLLQTLEPAADSIINNDDEGIAQVFEHCEDISIDYGVMEKSDDVRLVLGEFSWTDLGTWGSVYEQLEKDQDRNASLGKSVSIFGASEGNLIVNEQEQKKLAVLGIKDLIVVNTKDALLVCTKDSEQGIREIVKSLPKD